VINGSTKVTSSHHSSNESHTSSQGAGGRRLPPHFVSQLGPTSSITWLPNPLSISISISVRTVPPRAAQTLSEGPWRSFRYVLFLDNSGPRRGSNLSHSHSSPFLSYRIDCTIVPWNRRPPTRRFSYTITDRKRSPSSALLWTRNSSIRTFLMISVP